MRSLLLLTLAACGPQTLPAGQAPTSDETETDAADDGFAPLAPGQVGPTCDAYMDCLAETDADGFAAVLDQYGADGSCWTSGDGERCEQACASGLEDVLSGYEDLAPACMYGRSDDEVLEQADRLCPDAHAPGEVDEEDLACVVDAVLECASDAQEAVYTCWYEEPEPRNTTFEPGVWVMTYTPDSEFLDGWGSTHWTCELPTRFDVVLDGNGERVDQFDVLDDRGRVLHEGDCDGDTDVNCFFNLSSHTEAFGVIGTFSDPETFEGWASSKCGVWGTVSGTWQP